MSTCASFFSSFVLNLSHSPFWIYSKVEEQMFYDWYIREILSCVCDPNSQSHSGVNFFDMIRIWVISLETENRKSAEASY